MHLAHSCHSLDLHLPPCGGGWEGGATYEELWMAIADLTAKPKRRKVPLTLGAFASYKALWEMLCHPFYWDKTSHGHFDAQSPVAAAPPP